ncbi:putative membrane protein [Helicobacter pylori Hp H-21]|nr:putative membrane protein [Helicobacter pylori Hp H-21]
MFFNLAFYLISLLIACFCLGVYSFILLFFYSFILLFFYSFILLFFYSFIPPVLLFYFFCF